MAKPHRRWCAWGALGLAIALGGAGCGGGGGGSTAPVVSGSRHGVFSDAPVVGLHYVTSSQVQGYTDANGQFDFNPGDTITFDVGGLTLGQASATGQVTPADLAAGNTDKASNLLVLLQSLDTGAAGQRITLPASTAAFSLLGLDLSLTPTLFAQAAQASALVTAATRLGTAGLVSATQASQHAQNYFWGQVAGVWALDGSSFRTFLYLTGDATPYALNYQASDLNQPTNGVLDMHYLGVEVGGFNWSPLDNSYLLTVVDVDNNGPLGLLASNSQAGQTLKWDGQHLLRTDAAGGYSYTRLANVAGSIVGAWTLPYNHDGGDPVIAFSADGHYVVLQTAGIQGCIHQGVEGGSYSWHAGTGGFSVGQLSDQSTDCPSAIQQVQSALVSGAGQTLTLTLADQSTIVLTRLPG